ncbi:response regulator transcription factor [Francisellaceae bacterium CB299]|jgi:DNA-binding response OmpR family regulator
MKMRILLVDDDKEICSLLHTFFSKYGFKVEMVHSGEDALICLKNSSDNFDLIILDLHMSGICGIKTCKQIRAFSVIPILMLTSCKEDIQNILALEIGVDDYVTKPFNTVLLLARVKALIRRSSKELGNTQKANLINYSFGNCVFDTRAQLLLFKGADVHITTGLFQLLRYFIENPNIVITRDSLMETIKNRSLESFDRSIDVQISKLRKVLADCDMKDAIKTIHGAGYMWIPSVTRI